MIEKYNRLVRDEFAKTKTTGGRKPVVEFLDDLHFSKELDKRFVEFVSTYTESHDLDDMAEIMEVVLAQLSHRRQTMAEVMEIMAQKRTKYGAYKKRVFLKYVVEDTEAMKKLEQKTKESQT